MRMKLVQPLLMGLVFLCCATNLAAKSEAVDNGYYTSKDKEYYLTSDEIFFIRPGLNVEIIDAIVPTDLQPLVTFSIKDPGDLPLDIDGIFTPGPVDMRFMLTFIPQGEEQKVKLTEGSRDQGGVFTALGDGVYTYKFFTILPDIYEPDATHTLAVVGRRDLREFDLDRYVDNQLHNFVPSGLFAPAPRDVVTTETCNGRCHDPLAMHGGRYEEVAVCTQCHNPGLFARDGSGDSRSFDVLIHQLHSGGNLETPLIIGTHDYTNLTYPTEMKDCEVCHAGGTPTENFPLVATPNPVLVCDMSRRGTSLMSWGDLDKFEIHVGSANGPLFAQSQGPGSKETAKWVKDDTKFFLLDKATGNTIQELRVNATVLGCAGNTPGTFRGLAGAQHTNWLDHPSRLVCGSCHDGVNFATGAGHSEFEIIQSDDTFCINCHRPDYNAKEFDQSIRGAHMPLYKSAQFPGVLVDLISVTDTNPGDTPTVTFSLGSKNGRLDPSDLNRLRLAINGPNEDFDVYISETVGTNAVAVGSFWSYTFETPLPLDALGSYTASVEGRNKVDVDLGNEVVVEDDMVEPSTLAFAVTDAVAVPRRMVVDDAKCENCHSNLSLHGDNRKNANYCVTCHMPGATDDAVRPVGEFPEQSIHFKYMIHKIHRGAELDNGFVVYGYRSSLHDYGEVEYPGDLRNCDACHVNDSQQLPLPDGLLPTMTPQDWLNPTMPIASACLSCHDGDSATAHAASNTVLFGESCTTCHGVGKDFAIDKVHAQ